MPATSNWRRANYQIRLISQSTATRNNILRSVWLCNAAEDVLFAYFNSRTTVEAISKSAEVRDLSAGATGSEETRDQPPQRFGSRLQSGVHRSSCSQ